MKSVLISIQPKWCELIASGKKTVEIRKTKPNLATPFKCFIYQTRKTWVYNIYSRIADWQGKVIGEFVCDEIDEYTNYSLDEQNGHIKRREGLLRSACMTLKDWRDYIGSYRSDFGYCWHISDLVIYDEPRDLKNYQQCFKCEYRQSCVEGAECYDAEGWYALSRPPQSWCYVEVLR